MMRKPLVLFVLLAACDCGSRSEVDAFLADAAERDVPADVPGSDVPDTGGLPSVTPTSPTCVEAEVPNGAACVEHGWFWLGHWSTVTHLFGSSDPDRFPGRLPVPRQAVFLESFALDRTEVSAGEYATFVAASGAEPLPEECGYEAQDNLISDIDPRAFVPEVSESRPDHPAVCMTRAEARRYCSARGGRLPTVGEWMKAGQEPYPSFRRLPWGQSPPDPNSSTPGEIVANGTFRREYAAVGTPAGTELFTSPVGARLAGASPYGVLDLAGNVSELLADCREELVPVYGDPGSPVVRPAPLVKDTCSEALLLGGSNWRSFSDYDITAAMTIWSYRSGDPNGELYAADAGVEELDTATAMAGYNVFGAARPREGTPTDGAGNLRRSWRVGFRCAYDL